MKRARFLVIVVAVFSVCFVLAPAVAKVPMPKDVQVAVPSRDLPKGVKDLCGDWGKGYWGKPFEPPEGAPVELAIEKISLTKVSVACGMGNSAIRGWPAASWRRVEGKIVQRKGRYTIILQFSRSTMEFWRNGEKMKGEFDTGYATYYVNLKRIK